MRRLSFIVKAGSWIAIFRWLVAYLDPGSGSLIVQILVAIIVGALATFRLWKARLLSLFGIKQETDDADEDVEVENPDEEQA
ncbi:MAG: hypothetical protein OXG53_05800 [Chloroflexi bacterium]|nr:hypothetical protein [Chloroflexota bacterium]